MRAIRKREVAWPWGWLIGRWLAFAMFAMGMSARALVIVPVFDSTITNDANAATIEATINTAIQFYEARFSDPITVTIEFKEITGAGVFGNSSWWFYSLSYSQFYNALLQDASTTNDTAALAHIVGGANNPVTGTGVIRVKTANIHALGITNFNSGLTNGYDGIIGLNTSQLNLTRPSTNIAEGDLLARVEHELNEVLGLGSSLDQNAADPMPEDLFRYTTSGLRTYTTNGDNAYFSITTTTFPERFNQLTGYNFGDWWIAGAHVPQVQDAIATLGAAPNPKTELIALDVIGYNLLPLPTPVITRATSSGAQLVLGGTNGLASAAYVLVTTTNLTNKLSSWAPVATNLLATNGNFTFTYTNVVNHTETNRYFALRLQL